MQSEDTPDVWAWKKSPQGQAICPRCAANQTYRSENDMGTVSRTTRDDGAQIHVCAGCGLSEALGIAHGAGIAHFSEWPLSVDALLVEERRRIEMFRSAKPGFVDPDDLAEPS